MALVLKDRVLETASAPGTGTVTLLGATAGYQTFSAAIGNANTTYYTIADQSGANWEVGVGTYTTSGNTLTRNTVLSSSNGGSLVNFNAGTQNVFVTYPSEEAVYNNGTSIVGPTGSSVAVANGGTGATTLTGYVYGNGTSAMTASNTIPTSALTGTLAVGNGGTGATTLTANGVVYGNGTSAVGVTAVGSTGQVLVGNTGAAPSWATVSSSLVSSFSAGTTGFTPSSATTGAVTLAGTLGVANGGTGLTTLTANYVPYGNGTSALQSSANYTFDGTTMTLGNAGVTARFQGDFSNATVASRTAFITGTTNATTGIYALPNGTSTAASWQATNNSNPTNASKILIATNGSTDVQLVSGINGTGTYLPLSFYTNGAQKGQINLAGDYTAVGNIIAQNGIIVNATTLVSSFTVPSGSSASSVGGTSGFTIPSGLSVTVSSGSRWVVI